MGQTLDQFEQTTEGKSMLTGPNGIPGQCVGYMRLYIDQVLDLPQPTGKPGAKDQYLQYQSDPILKQNFKQIGPNGVLLPGDIVFWDANPRNQWGHVAICTAPSAPGQPFSVVEQNMIANTVGERAGVSRTEKNFLGALRPKDAIPGQKISSRALGLLKGAGSGLLSKFAGMLKRESMIDEFIEYSENFVSLKEKQENNFINKRLLQLSRDTGIKISSLLLECVPYINEDNLDNLYEDISYFSKCEKRLQEKSWTGWSPSEEEAPEELSTEEPVATEEAPAELSHGRKKTALKNEIIQKLKDYLQTKPRPDKRQVDRVKNQIMGLLGATVPAVTAQQVPGQQATAQATPQQQAATQQQAAVQSKRAPRQQRAQRPTTPQQNQANLVKTVQDSIPYGFMGGSNDKLKNKVTEIILNEYKNGDTSVESLVQKVKKGIGMTGFGSQNDLFNSLRLKLNNAASSGMITLTESLDYDL
jgi:hypothetical protein